MSTDLRALWRELREAPVSTHTSHKPLRRLRWAMAAAWLIGLMAWTEYKGPPVSLKFLLMWLGLAMLVASIGNPLGWAKSMLFDWFPLYLLLVAYDIAHGLVDNFGIRPHVDPQLGFDQALFGGSGPTHHLQNWLWSGTPSWYDHVLLVAYLSHFVVSLAVCAALWIRSRHDFLAYRRRIVGTWLLALLVFAAYPTVPPWMAADQGHLPAMDRIVAVLMKVVASSQTDAALEAGDGRISLANPVAAVPSMHAALPMLLLLFLWGRARHLRLLLLAYTVLMGFVLVYTGEHFVFDILAGWACAALVHAGYTSLERRRERKPSPPAAVVEADYVGASRSGVVRWTPDTAPQITNRPFESPAAVRPGATNRFGLVFTAIFLMLLGWNLATPAFGAPDEPAHVLKAAAVVRGQFLGAPHATGRLVTVPGALADLTRPVACDAHRRVNTHDCRRVVEPIDATDTRVTTPAGSYNPSYYVLVGSPMLLSPDLTGVYASRALSSLLCAALLALAFGSVTRSMGRRGQLAFAVALAPSVLYLSAVLNPNGLEICAALAVWAYVLEIALRPSVSRRAVHGLGLSAVVLLPLRGLSPIWLLLAVATGIALVHREQVRELVNRHGTVLGAWCVGALATTGLSILWTERARSLGDPIGGPRIGWADWLHLEPIFVMRRIRESIGTFGWNDMASPTFVYGSWLLLLMIGVAAIIAARSYRALGLVLLLGGFAVAMPALIDFLSTAQSAFIWQGRYSLPLLVGIPLTAAALVSGAGVLRRPRDRSVAFAGVIALLAVSHAVAFIATLTAYATASPDQYRATAELVTLPVPPAVACLAFFLGASLFFGLLALGTDGALRRNQSLRSPAASGAG